MPTISLTQGKEAVVCDCHYDLVKDHKWCYSPAGYAVRRVGGRKASLTYMHRFIKDTPKGLEVDHINKDKLDNRCTNLRCVTKRENTINRGLSSANTSGYKGVSWVARRNSYQASCVNNGKKVLHKYFKTAEEAARAYNEVALIYHGEYAQLNKIGK